MTICLFARNERCYHYCQALSIGDMPICKSHIQAQRVDVNAALNPLPSLPLGHMTCRDVVALWPSRKAMSADIGIGKTTIDGWIKLGRIPSSAMWTVLIAAQARGYPLTAEALLLVNQPPNAALALNHINPAREISHEAI